MLNVTYPIIQIGNMQEIKAPKFVDNKLKTVFLAGSIEMGTAGEWQKAVLPYFSNEHWSILNPRRDNWDSNLKQTLDCPEFVEQVTWELQGIEQADLILMYFDPKTKSPITLLELGLIAGKFPEKLVVVCPEGYWRKGNVDVVCNRYGIRQFDDLRAAANYLDGRSYQI